uniref:Tryptophan--tRNA ligase n=1 Tax=Panagrolaimus sp. JU765 TaxID=591449 RepID=A0AC34RIB0_9BILA
MHSVKFPKIVHKQLYFSGIQPTGVPHIGNYFGFVKNWIKIQNDAPNVTKLLSVVDLHAITTSIPKPSQLNANIVNMTAGLLACGVDPKKTILFQQSRIPEHGQLCWILGSFQTLTQLQRLPQFKDKSKRYGKGQVPLGLVSYPVLQSADVLLYKGTHVPVGEDQSQHMNLMADLAEHFNLEYKTDYFPIPQMTHSPYPRIKSLRDPSQKMSKSNPSEFSRIDLSDDADALHSKIKRALTDSNSKLSFDWEQRPGVSNLISIYGAFTGQTPDEIVLENQNLDTLAFKEKLIQIAETELGPIRKKYNELLANKAEIWEVLNNGSEQAREIAVRNLDEVCKIVGFRC